MSRVVRVTIVGGYGQVGKRIARYILERTGANVRIAGRSPDRAARGAAVLNCEWATIDIARAESWDDAIADADIVVVCLDQSDPAFPRYVLAQGKTYLDITAAYSFMQAVESLDEMARSAAGTAILSVGFAPGLTNLLVRSCAELLDNPERARICVLLGTGDSHGEAAILWTLAAAADSEAWNVQRTAIPFGRDGKVLASFPFPFADQEVVRKTLGLDDARTFLATEQGALMRLFFHAARWLKRRPLQRVFAAILARVHLGSDRAALAVEVSGWHDGQPSTAHATCEGRREADITAFVTALVVEHILKTPVAAGVHHIEQVMDPASVYAILAAHDVAITVSRNAHR